jgi:hypothetical protein
MKIFLALICAIALACAVGAQEPQKKEKKKGAPAAQVSKPGAKPAGVGKPAGQPTGMGKPAVAGKPKGKPAEVGKPRGVGKPTTVGKAKGKPSEVGKPAGVGKPTTVGRTRAKPRGVGKPAEVGTAAAPGKPTKGGKPTVASKPAVAAGGAASGKPYKPQHFNLPTKTTPTRVASVNFQQGRHIKGSQNWQGASYTVFRNYTPQWHDQIWWRSHYRRVVFVFGGWYYWNAGFWYPAWGYAPDAYYAYDGPIYAYNDLPPDQVIANVQAALQEQGYYQGEVDGLLGPLTRSALVDYQRDHGLYETAAIDRPTLESLGMA